MTVLLLTVKKICLCVYVEVLTDIVYAIFVTIIFHFIMFSGDSANAVPIRKNYALESPAFGVIAAVNLTEVQWKGLTLDRLRA